MMKKPTRWTGKLRIIEEIKVGRERRRRRRQDGRDSSSASSRLHLRTLDAVDLAGNGDASGIGVWGESQHLLRLQARRVLYDLHGHNTSFIFTAISFSFISCASSIVPRKKAELLINSIFRSGGSNKKVGLWVGIFEVTGRGFIL
ncbi:unnamed protein product [Linum tenue]|uniref:Uncharacterized protein n=1 Tax=Linum tenue TaxID=586396 RepID=A0AAV0MKE8_9ROSI|nr:unnamed protein product [Linum tenue]